MSKGSGVEHVLEIRTSAARIRVPKEKIQLLKGVTGAKSLARMKKECVECPVNMTTVSFVECFTCTDFIRRIKGQVHCSGKRVGQ